MGLRRRSADALRRTRRGGDPVTPALRFLPLKPGTNYPAITKWPERASADPNQWAQWRREFPHCNFGLLTGGGVGVIDLDTKNDPEGYGGFKTLIDVEEMLGLDLSNLPLSQTFSGAHLFFRYEGHLSSKVPWLPSIDVKADGGHQVAAPGTVREVDGVERVYTLVRGDLRDIPLAPPALLDAIRGWRIGRTGTGGSASPGAELPSTEEAIRDGLPLNSRNDFMHRLACRWWSKLGLDASTEVHALALVVWEATPGQDTFPWSEAKRAVQSAYEFVAAEQARNLAVIERWLGGQS